MTVINKVKTDFPLEGIGTPTPLIKEEGQAEGVAQTFFENLADSAVPENHFLLSDITGALTAAKEGSAIIHAQSLTPVDEIGTIGSKINGLLVSVLNIFRGKNFAKEGHQNQDGTRLFSGVARMIRGAGEFVDASFVICSSGVKLSSKAKFLQNGLAAFSMASLVGGTISSGCIGLTAASQASELAQIRCNFNKKKTALDKFDYLKNFTEITEEDKSKLLLSVNSPKNSWYQKSFGPLLQKFFGNEETKFTWKAKEFFALNAKVNRLKEQLQFDPSLKSEHKEAKEKLSIMLSELKKGKSNLDTVLGPDATMLALKTNPRFFSEVEGVKKKGLLEIFSLFYQLELTAVRSKKQAVFDRAFEESVRAKVQKTEVSEAEKIEIVQKAKKNLRKNIAFCCLIVFASLIVSALSIAASSLGVDKLVQFTLGCVATSIWLVIDGYYFCKSMIEEKHTPTEKLVMALNTIISVSANLIAFLFSNLIASVTSVAAPVVIILVWLAAEMSAIYYAKNKKKNESI